MTAHRALPLDVVEARARAARTPWPSCAGASCDQGRRPEACDCQPHIVDRLPEAWDESCESADGDALVWFFKGLCWLFVVVLVASLYADITSDKPVVLELIVALWGDRV